MAQFPSTTSASGIWSLKKQKRAQQGSNWPPLILPDDYFEYVSLLLPGNGTNGAQNNTFLDSSTNNFTITRNGNTTQGTFTPYGANWSNYFDGTGDYLNIASNNQFVASGVGFTVEAWVYYTSITNYSFVVASSTGANNYEPYWYIGSTNTGNWRISWGNATSVNTGISIALNTWHHVAISMSSSGSGTFYLNGVSRATSTGITLDTSATGVAIGHGGGSIAGLYLVTGYISNIRYVKNSSVYTANFTPPTTPLTAISGTALLTCQSNRFIDNSTNNFTITRNGDVSAQRFSPFNPTAPYAAGTIGGSGYFDGSGDYLVAPNDAAFAFGTGNFTVEAWVYGSLPGSGQSFIIGNVVDSSGSNEVLAIYLGSSGQIITSTWFTVLSTSASNVFMSNAWNHIAVARSGSTMSVFVNGTRVNTFSNSTNFSVTTGYRLGVEGTSSRLFTGYISNARVVKGTAVYDPSQTTITVPTSPLTAIANTQLLLNFTNGGIIDNAMMNDLETVGNAQISTSVSKFGGGSLAFDGSGDYLFASNNPSQRIMGGDFTVEMWMYLGAAQANMGLVSSYESNNGWLVRLDTTYIRFFYGISGSGTANDVTYSFSPGVWYHIAWVKSGASLRCYINGTQQGSTFTVSGAVDTATAGMQVGRTQTVSNDFNGYLDDLRITKGYARYTANFTPPTQAFPTY